MWEVELRVGSASTLAAHEVAEVRINKSRADRVFRVFNICGSNLEKSPGHSVPSRDTF